MQKNSKAQGSRKVQGGSKVQNSSRNSTSTLQNVWGVLRPFLMYYLLYIIAFLVLSPLCRTAAELVGGGLQSYLTDHTETMTGLVNGLSMVIGVLPLLPMLRVELQDAGDPASAGKKGRRGDGRGTGFRGHPHAGRGICEKAVGIGSVEAGERGRIQRGGLSLLLTIVFAVSAALGLNIVLTLSGLVQTSATYQDVAQQQYGVAFGLGVILYGLTAPVTEEIVFRGLIFNRLRRFCPHAAAVILSGVLFGVYHGNLVQGLYGGCMGILMAYLYERRRSFLIPCVFHAAANLAVYVTAQNAELQGMLFTVYGGVSLLAIAALCVLVVEKCWNTRQ